MDGLPAYDDLPPLLPADRELRLRPWAPADVPAVLAACLQPSTQRWIDAFRGYDEGSARRYVLGAPRCVGAAAASAAVPDGRLRHRARGGRPRRPVGAACVGRPGLVGRAGGARAGGRGARRPAAGGAGARPPRARPTDRPDPGAQHLVAVGRCRRRAAPGVGGRVGGGRRRGRRTQRPGDLATAGVGDPARPAARPDRRAAAPAAARAVGRRGGARGLPGPRGGEVDDGAFAVHAGRRRGLLRAPDAGRTGGRGRCNLGGRGRRRGAPARRRRPAAARDGGGRGRLLVGRGRAWPGGDDGRGAGGVRVGARDRVVLRGRVAGAAWQRRLAAGGAKVRFHRRGNAAVAPGRAGRAPAGRRGGRAAARRAPLAPGRDAGITGSRGSSRATRRRRPGCASAAGASPGCCGCDSSRCFR